MLDIDFGLIDLEIYQERFKTIQREYRLKRTAILESKDFSEEAKGRLIKAARDRYAQAIRQAREAMRPELEAANAALTKAKETTTLRQVEALYSEAVGKPTQAMMASRLVEIADTAQLLELYKTGDPLLKGFIALAPGRYADEQDPAAGRLRSTVNSDAGAELKEVNDLLRKANQLYQNDMDENPEASLFHVAKMTNQGTMSISHADEFTAQELEAARREIPRMLEN